MDRVLDINVRGVYVATQAALKHMKSGGRVITIGSAGGERVAAPGLVPYAGTKGAVKMFTQALAREIGSRGITVNNGQPGPIDTELNPASGDWAVPQRPPRRSIVTGVWMRSPRWWRLSQVRSPRTSPARALPSMAE